jgi:hypothetical protein
MMSVRLDWLTERQEAYEQSLRRMLGIVAGGNVTASGAGNVTAPERRPDGRPALAVLKGGQQ